MDSIPHPGPAPVPTVSYVPPRKVAWYSWRRLGFNFLTLSLLVHVFLGVGATYFVVSIASPKKKTFAAPPASGAQHAAEHKVSIAKAQQRSSAPVAVKRVVTTGASKVSLPAMPMVSVDNSVVTPVSMSGMGGQGIGGLGAGGNGNGNGDGGGGGGASFFGVRSGGKGLVGTFYDLKQTPGRQPTKMTIKQYIDTATQFVRSGFNDATFSRYYKAPQPIYADRIFTPNIPAVLGPTAFGVQKEVEPKLWVVHYKGTVVPPESGTYHFVGTGDDLLLVRFEGRLVLNGSIVEHTEVPGGQEEVRPGSKEHYLLRKGVGFQVEEGHPYTMDVLIGECPGGWSEAVLMIVKDGTTYAKDSGGLLAPIFRLSNNTALPPPPPGSKGYVAHAAGGSVWRILAADSASASFGN